MSNRKDSESGEEEKSVQNISLSDEEELTIFEQQSGIIAGAAVGAAIITPREAIGDRKTPAAQKIDIKRDLAEESPFRPATEFNGEKQMKTGSQFSIPLPLEKLN